MMTTTMTPKDAWLYAASWGSLIRSGDPGACMYGFNESCRPQSEEHRQAVLEYVKGCRAAVEASPEDYDDDELEKMDAFVEFITNRGITGQEREPFIIEISLCGSVSVCKMDGSEIDGDLLNDLADCNASGDCEPACRYVLDQYKPEFRIVRKVGDKYENVIASAKEKKAVCKTIYFDSETDFDDEDNCNVYLMWEAAHDEE